MNKVKPRVPKPLMYISCLKSSVARFRWMEAAPRECLPQTSQSANIARREPPRRPLSAYLRCARTNDNGTGRLIIRNHLAALLSVTLNHS